MTGSFDDRALSDAPDEIAPDGFAVRLLARTAAGSMGHFTLPAGHTTRAVRHRTVDEIWFFLSGSGELWRAYAGDETVSDIRPGLSVAIPVGTTFQVRNTGTGDIRVVGQTMPPWPGDDEAVICEGRWAPTVSE